MNPLYIALTLVSGLCWTGVYLAVIYRGSRDRACGMPLYALAFNLGWELLYAFVFTGSIALQNIINVVWFALDLLILTTWLRFGRDEFPAAYRSWFIPWRLAALVVGVGTQLAAQLEFPGLRGAMYSAFTINLVMSLLFIAMLARRGSVRGQSLLIAALKWLGTLAPTILFYSLTGSILELVLGGAVCVFDLAYIFLLYLQFQRQGLHPLTRRPIQPAQSNPA